jgi:predicted TIM-barrel fold metal-dependent hydrolase
MNSADSTGTDLVERVQTGAASSVRAPYLVVACDSHAGPSLEVDLRSYCPAEYLDEYDEFTRFMNSLVAAGDTDSLRSDHAMLQNRGKVANRMNEDVESRQRSLDDAERVRHCLGLTDLRARTADMDHDGVAVDVIFAGGQNGEVLPFIGTGWDGGMVTSRITSAQLRAVGGHIWNRWLSDFVSDEPLRHIGVIQIPIWDIDAAVREISWAHSAGLGAVNLPASRPEFPAYNQLEYEPLWTICEELGLPLVTHAALEYAMEVRGPGGVQQSCAEVDWLTRRALWQLIFGGVFDRHPGLKIVFTEAGIDWVPQQLRELESIWLGDRRTHRMPENPREYWRRHCYLSGSSLAPFEVAMHAEIGDDNLMWGSDYPHSEGTWPWTRQAIRNTFCDMPTDLTRKVLGENAVKVFNLDAEALAPIAARIGPRPAQVSVPLSAGEIPEFHGLSAFRQYGRWG